MAHHWTPHALAFAFVAACAITGAALSVVASYLWARLTARYA